MIGTSALADVYSISFQLRIPCGSLAMCPDEAMLNVYNVGPELAPVQVRALVPQHVLSHNGHTKCLLDEEPKWIRTTTRPAAVPQASQQHLAGHSAGQEAMGGGAEMGLWDHLAWAVGKATVRLNRQTQPSDST